MAGYTRNDTANNIADGNIINAADLDGEFDAIQAAFNATTGHTHDGSTGNGPQIGTLGLANLAVTNAKLADSSVTGIKIDPNTTITATQFIGALSGNVTGNVVGNVTGTASNADKLDNIDSTKFVRTDVPTTVSSVVTHSSNIILRGNETAIIFDTQQAGLGGDLGIKGSGESFVIFEPEDSNKVWLTIDDDPAGSNTAFKINSTAGMSSVFHDAYHPNADKWTTARSLTLTGDVTGSVSWDGSANASITATVVNDSHTHDTRYPTVDAYNWRGTGYLTSTTTSALKSELLSRGAFNSSLSAFKTGWSYAGNGDLTDAGGLTELAGTSWLTWTDNSTDGVQGNITALVIAPSAGPSAGGVFIYNDQGSSYTPGWREVWTSATDGSGSGLDADLLDGVQGSQFLRSDANDTMTGLLTMNNTIAFNDVDRYWLSTATNWGLYWDTVNNQLEMHGAGTARFNFDLDDGHGYAGGSWRAPIFYDNNNTAYYTNQASTSYHNLQRVNDLAVGTSTFTGGAYVLDVVGASHMHNSDINYVNQLHFNDNVRFFDNGDDSYLNFKFADASAGGIIIKNAADGNCVRLYGNSLREGGLLDSDGSWAVRVRTSTNPLELYCDNNLEFYVYNSYTYSPGSSRAPIFYDSDNTAYYANPSSTSVFNQINAATLYVGGGVYLQESSDRADLLQISSNTTGWAGLQIRNTSNEGRWSFMTDGESAGIYNDEDNQWHILMTEVAGVALYYAAAVKLSTTSAGVSVTGSLTASSNVTAYSDIRIKDNIEKIPDALDKVTQLNGYTYDRTDDRSLPRQTGVIAQEVLEVLPEAVIGGEDGLYSVAYGNMVGLLIEAIKEQQKQIDDLRTQLEAK